jgi:hypothetical protein
MGIGFTGLLLQSPVCFGSVQVCQMPIEGKESEKGAENRRQRHDPLNRYMSDQQCDLGRPPQRDCHASNSESAMTEGLQVGDVEKRPDSVATSDVEVVFPEGGREAWMTMR